VILTWPGAAEQDLEQIKGFCTGAELYSLSRGSARTGTGASSGCRRAAREAGALVLAMVTMPFEFEGGRRQRQALNGLQALKLRRMRSSVCPTKSSSK